MARSAIIEKLAGHLKKTMATEAAVVYFMVEVRKLLEHENTKEQFPLLNFYCNWVVHTKLDQSPIADKIVRLNDDLLAYTVSASESLIPIKELTALLDQSALRQELEKFLGEHGLPSVICESSSSWNRFQRLLGFVIEDVPLRIDKRKKQRTRYVESVSIRNVPLKDEIALNFKWKTEFHTQPEGKLRRHPGLTHIGSHPTNKTAVT